MKDTVKDLSKQAVPRLEPRDQQGHKGNYGRVLLVGGSRGMAGSISLSGMAALRSGAGLVTIATPRCVQSTVASFSPAYMTVGLADDDDRLDTHAMDPLMELVKEADVIAIGPGLGRSPAIVSIVEQLYTQVAKPMVVDADALNALAKLPEALATPRGPRVLTPHPGEFARLTGDKLGARPSTRTKGALALALRDKSHQTIVVLKGSGTVVANHKQHATNATGNPGMGTGGAGDVLTGVIAALLAQGLDAWQSARLGVHVHGLAGDHAAEKLGQVSLIATDIVDYLPSAFRELGE
ncbi:NAD(P)H-hydrate dehydratase [Aeoliella sp. SH292]|uniref:NAD(P)H-hydrate dehydratase n=1 Tax=Aeoliella sp. SH292 TaxID=3454464 RepID=UPI003F9A9151